MNDEILKKHWDTKDNFAKEQGYKIDDLANYYSKEQVARDRRFHQNERGKSRTKRST